MEKYEGVVLDIGGYKCEWVIGNTCVDADVLLSGYKGKNIRITIEEIEEIEDSE